MQIHILRDSEQFGPYTEEEVQEYLDQGTLLPTDMAWHEGIDTWVALNEVVKQPKSKAPPPPPPKKIPPAKAPFQWKRPRVIYPSIGLVLLVILYIASPYYAAYTLRNALIKGDQDQLESSIDFPSVRESLKTQLKSAFARLVLQGGSNNAFAGMASLIAPTIIDNGVDLYITPEGIAALANNPDSLATTHTVQDASLGNITVQHQEANPNTNALSPKLIASTFLGLNGREANGQGFVSLTGFVIKGGQAKLYLHFYGWGWKLDKIELTPNFDLPSLLTMAGNNGNGSQVTSVFTTISAPLSLPIVTTSISNNSEATSDVQQGWQNQCANNLDGAIQNYSNAIALDSNYADAYYHRGLAKQQKNDINGSLADFDQAVALNPSDVHAYRERGNIKQGNDDLDGALADYDKVIQFDSTDYATLSKRGMIKRQKGDLDGAIADDTKANEYHPGTVTIELINAKELKGDLSGAIEDFYKTNKSNPNAIFTVTPTGSLFGMIIADIKRRKGDLAGEQAIYNNLIDMYNQRMGSQGENPSAYLELAEIKKASGDMDGANSNFDKAIQIQDNIINSNPTANAIYGARAEAKQAKGDLDGAIADYTKCIDNSPPNWGIAFYARRGEAEVSKGEIDEAITDFDKGMQAVGSDVNAHYLRGIARQQKADLEGALKDFTYVIQQDPLFFAPDRESIYFHRADIKKQKGDLDGAIADYTQSTKLDPRNVHDHHLLANAQWAKGNWGATTAEYIQVAKLRPIYMAVGAIALGCGFVLLVLLIRLRKT